MNKKNLQNLPFIITMSLFAVACIVITLFAVKREPQYVRVLETQQKPPDTTESSGVITNAAEINKININTANAEELMTLTGIGETIAERIVEYRRERGGFSSIDEIMEVSGIGEKVFENIKACIIVD
ncbi:MAG: helix-hairpin-helix domain-containing protein [Oscillospiraceae bacterium]|nr:helix-hairpin-helix domain-containing protein [Oscillospiraceae bacterium]